jgi:mono/diheme cytochrome c family protein
MEVSTTMRWAVARLLLIGVTSLWFFAGVPALCAVQAASLVPPFDLQDPAAVEAGAQLFRQSCTGYCHGKEGRLSRAPRLRGQKFAPEYLYARIANGSPPMPAYKTVLPEADIWKLIAYILSLADAKED